MRDNHRQMDREMVGYRSQVILDYLDEVEEILKKSYDSRDVESIDDKSAKYVPLSRDTFKRLEKEIMQMPPREVARLPDDLRDWITSIRPEIAVEVESYEQSYRGQTDHDQHTKNLRELTHEWIGQLRWPSPRDLPDAHGGPGDYQQGDFCWVVLGLKNLTGYRPMERPERVQIRCCIEGDPLFAQLQEHLEGNPVWADYQQFKNEGGKYWIECKKLRELEEDQRLEDELDLQTPMQDVEKLDEEMQRQAERPRDKDDEIDDLIVEDFERQVRLVGKSTGSRLEYAKVGVERRTRKLPELKQQITRRLREILDKEGFPGTCSKCSRSD